jgi:multidrug efflux pump subunit AcrB
VDINRERAAQMGVAARDIASTLQVYLGSLYVNDFNRFGRTWQVVVQADAKADDQAAALRQLKVRNAKGEMVPLAALVKVRTVQGPDAIDRLNLQPMVEVTANPAAGVSQAEARALCDKLVEQVRRELRLPGAYRLTWLPEPPASR